MVWLNGLMRVGTVVVIAVLAAGCSSPASMSPQQKEAFELRRYCERMSADVARCTGFLGDL